MNSNAFRVACLVPTVLACTAGTAAASGFDMLSPHRAVYDLVLDEASERSGIESMNGRIVYEVTGNECDGISVRYRLVTNISTANESYQTDQQTATFESPDGLEFNFLTKSFVDQRPESTVKGTAIRTPEGVKVSLAQPDPRDIELPPAIFISSHLIDVIDAAKRGERMVKRDIFDGSDGADEVVATATFIGEGRVADELLEGESPQAIAAVKESRAWPVTVSYFDKGLGRTAESVPVYEASFLLYENGISRKLVMRYPDYSLAGHLTSLEILKKEPCKPSSD